MDGANKYVYVHVFLDIVNASDKLLEASVNFSEIRTRIQCKEIINSKKKRRYDESS